MYLYNINLFDEIYEILSNHDLTIFDIDYVLINGFKVDTLLFLNACYKINYDNSYGRAFINPDLFIVLNNGSWLERCTYDGSEWFEFKSFPKSSNKLCSCSIAEMVDIIKPSDKIFF